MLQQRLKQKKNESKSKTTKRNQIASPQNNTKSETTKRNQKRNHKTKPKAKPQNETKSETVLYTMVLVFQMTAVTFVDGWSLDTNKSSAAETCRDRMNYLPVESFRLTTCAFCYYYLFMDDLSKELYPDDEWLVHPNATRISADIYSDPSRTEICATLSAEECQRWDSCCREAERCCSQQRHRAVGLEEPPTTYGGKPLCPQTWDGYGCWDYTLPGKVASGSCPEYIKYAFPSGR